MRSTLCSALLAALALSVQAQDAPTAAYDLLTNNFRDVTNFNVETTRGMGFASDLSVYMISTHASLLLRQTDFDPEPEGRWTTLNNPIAMQVVGDFVLVLGGATHALAVHDRFTGEILAVCEVPSEPGDLVVDEAAGIAYVSSQAENVVVAVSLPPEEVTEIARYAVPGERTRRLALDTHPVTGEAFVVVTPELSGNNTIPVPGVPQPDATLAEATGDIRNLSANADGGLPDEDVFFLPRFGAPVPATFPSGRAAGTIMTAHGRNPLTGEYWALGVDLHNDRVGQRTEAELRGDFATNTLAIFAADVPPAPRTEPARIVDLDDTDPLLEGPQYAVGGSIAFPSALAFVPPANVDFVGWAVVAGTMSDRFLLLDPTGTRVLTWELPEGAIVRDLVMDPLFGRFLLVYCWGTNEVLFYDLAALWVPPVVWPLGPDPTPEAVRRGREIFYDAERSRDGRFTCGTCHVGGGNDGLAWKLAGLADDQKDIMVTQTLRGIQDTPLYHWRGERTLEQFNGAFTGLLGHTEMLDESPGGELADFVAFVFSLQPHANHRQNLRRVIDDAQTPDVHGNGLIGSAVQGQQDFLQVEAITGTTCATCHMLPNGTQAKELPDGSSRLPRMMNLDTTHLRQLNHREQDFVPISDPILGDVDVPRGGYGFSHSGSIRNLFEFTTVFPGLTPDQQANITAFVMQFDQGIAPAVHASVHLHAASTEADVTRIRELMSQVPRRWIDLVATGRTTVGGESRAFRALYVPGPNGREGAFQANRDDVPDASLAELQALAVVGEADLVLLGVPFGEGRRWALDPDADGLTDAEELALGTDPYERDTDGDGFSDGHEQRNGADPLTIGTEVLDVDPPVVLAGYPVVDHVTAGYAKILLQASEPVTVRVEAAVPGGPTHTTEVHVPAERHTLVLQELDPSTRDGLQNVYTATITLTDAAGNSSATSVTFAMRESLSVDQATYVSDLRWVETTPNGFILDAIAEVQVMNMADRPNANPVVDRRVLFQVLYRETSEDEWRVSPLIQSEGRARRFQVRSVLESGEVIETYSVLPGPFLVSPPTDATGRAQVTFRFPGVQGPPPTSLQVRLSVQGVLEASPGFNMQAPVFELPSLGVWSMPSTKEEHRGIELQL